MFDKKIIYFITVVEEGSFSAAGRKLFLSQAAISQHVALLEKELSVQLFDRSGYRPQLTEAGRFYYEECLHLMTQYQDLKKRLLHMYHQTIRIGFTGSYENKDILLLVNQFKKKHPVVEISFVEGNFDTCIDNLLHHKIDVSFGLESDFKREKDMTYHYLHSYHLCVICSYDHPLAKYDEIDISQIKNENFIILSKKFGKNFYKDFMKAFQLDHIKPKIKKSVDFFDELVFHVSIGEGIAIVSDDVVRDSDVKKIKLLHSHHQSHYAIGYKKDLNNPVIEDFIKESIQYFQTL